MEEPYSDSKYKMLICDFENIDFAVEDVGHGKKFHKAYRKFMRKYEENVIGIINSLIWCTYEHSWLNCFVIHEPKLRQIAAPQVPDRIIHHAYCQVMEPVLTDDFMPNSFACRKGYGLLMACQVFSGHINEVASKNGGSCVIVEIDIRKYFQSIPHWLIMAVVGYKTSFDKYVLWLTDKFLQAWEQGIPIGFLPSQMYANMVGNLIDHYIAEKLGIHTFVRFMDDFRITLPNREAGYAILSKVEEYILSLGLQCHVKKTKVKEFKDGDFNLFTGYKVFPDHLEAKPSTISKALKRVKKQRLSVDMKIIPSSRLKASLGSFLAYMRHCNWNDRAWKVIKASGLEVERNKQGYLVVKNHRHKFRTA